MRGPGRPRDVQAARRCRVLEGQVERLQRKVEAHETAQRAAQEKSEGRALRLAVYQLFHGASLRSAAVCQDVAFPEEASSKSTLQRCLEDWCLAAEELHGEYFAGRGREAACDEIYLSGHPVLEAVEPYSLAITGIRSEVMPTEVQWRSFLKMFEHLEMAVSDQGLGLTRALAAEEKQERIERCVTDSWHLLRPFASAVGRREGRAYERIADEEEKKQTFLAVLPCAPGMKVPVELERIEKAQEQCAAAIALYDQVQTLLEWLRESLRPVDGQGRIRTEEQIRGDWEAALDLVDTVPAEEFYALERKLRGKIDGAAARGLVERLSALPMPPGWNEDEREGLQQAVCQAWNYHHRQQTHLHQAPCQAARTVAERLGWASCAPHLEAYCRAVFEILDRTLIASSAVECVNSVIRLREGGKRHPNPKFVYFLAWLHNTRPFEEGRRKGLTPAELLGVKLPADGLTMLLERTLARRQNSKLHSLSALSHSA